VREHMPKSHQAYGDWSPKRFRQWAEKTGPATAQLIDNVLSSRRHLEQSYRSCLGILRLGKSYGGHRHKSIESILRCGLDQQPLPTQDVQQTLPEDHDNLRGASYYH